MHYDKNFTGNERFFGFCVDILARVANEVGFDYILDLVPDKKYGAKDPITGEWNGMVLQLMKHVSEMTLSWLSISRQNSNDVTIFQVFFISVFVLLEEIQYRNLT